MLSGCNKNDKIKMIQAFTGRACDMMKAPTGNITKVQKVAGGYVRRKVNGYIYGQAGTEADSAGND